MRVAYNDSDDRAGLRGYVQFNKYTYIHTFSKLGKTTTPFALLHGTRTTRESKASTAQGRWMRNLV